MGLLAPAAKASPGVFHRLEPMENRWIFLHFDFESATNKDSTNVLKRPPEERNVENNSDICDIVSSIVLDFLVHHKNKNFGAYT